MDPLLAIALMRVEAALLRTCGSQLHKQRRGHLDPDMHQKLFIKLPPCAPLNRGNRLRRAGTRGSRPPSFERSSDGARHPERALLADIPGDALANKGKEALKRERLTEVEAGKWLERGGHEGLVLIDEAERPLCVPEAIVEVRVGSI